MQLRVHDCWSHRTQSRHCISTMTDASHFDYPWWKTTNHQHCVDGHLHDRARSVSLPGLPLMAANTLIICSNVQITLGSPALQSQILLTLGGLSFSEWGSERVALSFAYKASQYRMYEWLWPIATHITNGARPQIVDTPLLLILPGA